MKAKKKVYLVMNEKCRIVFWGDEKIKAIECMNLFNKIERNQTFSVYQYKLKKVINETAKT